VSLCESVSAWLWVAATIATCAVCWYSFSC